MEYHTVFFGNKEYKRLLDALVKSVESNSKHKLIIHELPTEYRKGNRHLANNSQKLEKWGEIVYHATDDVVLLDCDTILLKDVGHVFNDDFDVAYTKRSKGVRFPLNGGVVFVKPTVEAKKFFIKWIDINTRMMSSLSFHHQWKRKYAGINQASFGFLLESNPTANIKDYDCAKYNACDTVNWLNDLDKTHILHIKSELRNACLRGYHSEYHQAVKLWGKYDIKKTVSS